MLEIRADPHAPLGTPLATGLRGAGEQPANAAWRARLVDDDGRTWRTEATSAAELGAIWDGGDDATPCAALGSLRPVSIDVHVELADGRSAKRAVKRTLTSEAVKIRRWRHLAPLAVTVYIPPEPTGALIVTAGPEPQPWLPVAAAALARGGALVATVRAREGRSADEGAVADALRSIPGAPDEIRNLQDLPIPPGLPRLGGPDDWQSMLKAAGLD